MILVCDVEDSIDTFHVEDETGETAPVPACQVQAIKFELSEPDYENPWILPNGLKFNADALHLKTLEGFVYRITNLINRKEYYGKKTFWFRRKRKKKDIRRTTFPSDWKGYYGSSVDLTKDVETIGTAAFKREILYLCKNKKSMTYYEAFEQFKNEVIFHPEKYYNMTVLGKFFLKDGKLVGNFGISKTKSNEQIAAERSARLIEKNAINNPFKNPVNVQKALQTKQTRNSLGNKRMNWIILKEDGSEEYTDNLHEYCDKNELNYSSLFNATRNGRYYRGIKLKKA